MEFGIGFNGKIHKGIEGVVDWDAAFGVKFEVGFFDRFTAAKGEDGVEFRDHGDEGVVGFEADSAQGVQRGDIPEINEVSHSFHFDDFFFHDGIEGADVADFDDHICGMGVGIEGIKVSLVVGGIDDDFGPGRVDNVTS